MADAGADVRARLQDARVYLCVDRRSEHGDLEAFLDLVLPAGVDVVQLREKGLEARDELAALDVVAAAAGRHRTLWSVNDRADLARAAGAPILHLGHNDLPPAVARDIVGDDTVIGVSTHDSRQLAAAASDAAVDYFCAGPTWATPTKPGRPAAGLALLDEASRASRGKPWFAIGGIDIDRLDTVVAHGARRVVVVRAITEAADPAAAAAAFATRLRAAANAY